MSRAICDLDRVEVPWSGFRGARLADHPCPICGGKLRAAKLSEARPEVVWARDGIVQVRYPYGWPGTEKPYDVRNLPRSFFPPPREWGAKPEAPP